MNKPRVAVLLFGQPRYINVNYKALKEEFCHEDGTPFDIFAHFWKDVGFSPKGEADGSLYDYTSEIKHAREHLNIKDIKVENNDRLDEFCIHVENVIRTLNKQFFKKTITDFSNKRYKWGQHLSLLTAYNMLQSYENKFNLGTPHPPTKQLRFNPQRYDIVIKARTDFTYKNIECYKSPKEYYKTKADNYINFNNFDVPIIKTSGVQFQQYNNTLEKWEGSSDYKCKRDIPIDFTNLKWVRDNNNLFRIGDISLAANRPAAKMFFAEYLNMYLHTFLDDYYHRANKTYDRHDAVQGDIAYYNNIKVYKVKCRFFRLARDWDCKLCWRNTRKNGTIVFPSIEEETYEFMINEMKRIISTGKDPAPFG